MLLQLTDAGDNDLRHANGKHDGSNNYVELNEQGTRN